MSQLSMKKVKSETVSKKNESDKNCRQSEMIVGQSFVSQSTLGEGNENNSQNIKKE